MSDVKQIISSDENLKKFFKDKPIYGLIRRELTVDIINSEILTFDPKFKSKQSDKETKFDEQKKLFVKTLTREVIDKVKYLCTFHVDKEVGDEAKAKDAVDVVFEEDFSRFSLNQSVSHDKTILMIYLDEFLRQTQSQLRETAAEKISKQETIDDVESSSKKVGAKVDELIKKWQEKKAKFNDKINPKLHMTEELKIDMNQMTTKTDDEIDGLILDANFNLIKKTKSKLDQIKSAQQLVESTSELSLAQEKEMSMEIQKLTEQKIKAEQSLQTVLLKFDTDVGSRSDDVDAIRAFMKTEQENFDDWQEKIMKPQIIAYEQLMREKAEYERREIEMRLEEIRQNHAAKVIQKGWRKFSKKKREAERLAKGRKDKKKKK